MASDPSIGACDDVDSLLAVTNDGSGAEPSIYNNGDNTLAVVDSPGLETNDIAQSSVCRPLINNYFWDTYHCNGPDQRCIPF